MHKNFFTVLLLLFTSLSSYAAEYKQIRSVSVLPTKHFDIIFPRECTHTAQLIAQHCDEMYEKAGEELKLQKFFRMPVVISPDSDVLSVTYSASPYNRIVIYDAMPDAENAYYGNTVLNQFNREVVRGVSLSIRSPAWQFLSSFLSIDALQPAYLLNMPLSFVEGICSTMGNTDDADCLNDWASLQLLSQAKLENKFPTWMQASGVRDIYPGKKTAQAAGSAFAAYLQQRWGMQQYVDFWHASGDVHLFALTAGIFKTVYNVDLRDAWKDFEDTIPLPSDIEEMKVLDSCSTAVFPNDQDGLAKYILQSPYGAIWYDDARHEVEMLTSGNKKIRLFTATDVTHLSLSADGQYIAVSYKAEGCRNHFVKQRVRIYDVPGRTFLHDDFPLRDSCIIKNADGTFAVAGIYPAVQHAELRVYRMDDNDNILYQRAFPPDVIPYITVSPHTGTIACLALCENKLTLFSANIDDGTERSWTLPYMITSLQCTDEKMMFTYLPEEPGSFSRFGYIQLDNDGMPVSLSLQNTDVSGGIHDPAAADGVLMYSAHKASYFEIRTIPFDKLSFETEEIEERKSQLPRFDPEDIPVIEKKETTDSFGITKTKKFLNDYQLNGYNPLPYMFRGTWIPMLPLYQFSLDDSEYQLAPGLGVTYLTQSDPIDSTEGVLSFSAAFADPATNYLTFDDDYTFSAYVKNSSLPVDIALGGTWQFTNDGDYTLQALGAVKWLVPLDMCYHNLSFSVKELFTLSTSYKDTDTEVTEKIAAWSPLWEAYKDNCFSLTGAYNNYHQAGISAYEQLGFETDVTLVLDYDSQKTTEEDDGITDPSRIGFVIKLGFKLPHLLPFPYLNNFVIGMPFSFQSQWYGVSGTSCDTNAEVLIVGWESQFGIPILNLYLHRIGLKAGYDLQLNYDTVTFPEPDLRNISDYIDVLKSATCNDYVYLRTDAVLSPVVGFMTSLQVTAGVQYRYYIRKNTFGLAAVISAKM